MGIGGCGKVEALHDSESGCNLSEKFDGDGSLGE
jgi:hypothetical protein